MGAGDLFFTETAPKQREGNLAARRGDGRSHRGLGGPRLSTRCADAGSKLEWNAPARGGAEQAWDGTCLFSLHPPPPERASGRGWARRAPEWLPVARGLAALGRRRRVRGPPSSCARTEPRPPLNCLGSFPAVADSRDQEWALRAPSGKSLTAASSCFPPASQGHPPLLPRIQSRPEPHWLHHRPV